MASTCGGSRRWHSLACTGFRTLGKPVGPQRRLSDREPDGRTSLEPDVARSVAARDELEGAFRQLTPEQRAVVVLHHHLGYPLTEIAATLGIPEGTALDESSASLVTSEERPA